MQDSNKILKMLEESHSRLGMPYENTGLNGLHTGIALCFEVNGA